MIPERESPFDPADVIAAGMTRRQMLARGGVGAIAAMSIFHNGRLLTPTQAKAAGAPLVNLTAEQGSLLEAVGEALLPGSRDAGIANFVDVQLGRETPMLIVRYFDWPGPLKEFYTQGLAAVDKASQAAYKAPFAKATPTQQTELMGNLFADKVAGWDGPTAPIFYLAVRGDAVDVVYGTVEGFQRLNIPYMPHILPEERW
ncbi:MAG: gluconate 2-dehydrogenase subunit 3 family protein [Thermomicrobiales bacterium]|nr:gluconate 2-dehydrogenase subunit 3 family protein [Thermomicrobiales bacterium]